MADTMTVSSSQGGVAEWHDARVTTPKNADKILADKNEHWIGDLNKSDADKFNEIFKDDVIKFNAKQTRPSRKMGMESTNPDRQKSYYDGIVDGTFCTGSGKMKETPIYEAVLQIGNKNDNGVTDKDFDMQYWKTLKKSGHEQEASDYVLQHLSNHPNKERTKRIIHKAIEKIATLDPEHLKVLRADWHEDEPCGTGHAHLAYVLKATGYKTGMESRVASVKALEQMGFKKTRESEYGIVQLHEKFKSIIEEEMIADALEYGYDAIQRAADSGEHRKRSDVDTFREMMEEQEALDSYKSNLEEQERHIRKKKASVKKEQERLTEKEKALNEKEKIVNEKESNNIRTTHENIEFMRTIQSRKKELEEQEKDIRGRQEDLDKKEYDVQGKSLKLRLDADKLSQKERDVSQKETDLNMRENLLLEREEDLSEREKKTNWVEDEQWRITNELMEWRDKLQIQEDDISERENALTPCSQVYVMMGMFQKIVKNLEVKEAARLIQTFVGENREKLNKLYLDYQEHLRVKVQRDKEQLLSDTRFDVPRQPNDYEQGF